MDGTRDLSCEEEKLMLKAGDIAPDFTVKTHEGNTLTRSSLRGHKVLLWFYPKADTPGCTAEGCSLRDQYSYYQENNIVVLGVSFDNVEDNAAFVKKFGFPFTLLCDTDRSLGLAYGACDNPQGRLRQPHQLPDRRRREDCASLSAGQSARSRRPGPRRHPDGMMRRAECQPACRTTGWRPGPGSACRFFS